MPTREGAMKGAIRSQRASCMPRFAFKRSNILMISGPLAATIAAPLSASVTQILRPSLAFQLRQRQGVHEFQQFLFIHTDAHCYHRRTLVALLFTVPAFMWPAHDPNVVN